MGFRIFIDGAAGTTGLEIRERLMGRIDLDLVTLGERDRKDANARRDALNGAGAVILCLPDEAAREAAALIDDTAVKVIDASSAHRTAAGWAYGFPELAPGARERIAASRRVSNPGCYATGFLAMIAPLVRERLISADQAISVNAVSGYSGGGKAMIADFEQADSPDGTGTVFRLYALHGGHKHVAEMQAHAGLAQPPLFTPSVARTYRGMLVEVPLTGTFDPNAIREALANTYAGSPIVRVASVSESSALLTLPIERCAGTDRLELFVFGDSDRVRLVAALDNLGKGAAGAAVQNLNLMLGLDETAGLKL